MRFLIDEDLPRSVQGLLLKAGHDSIDVRDTDLRGAGDAEIASYAKKHSLCLLSGDIGFADIRNYPPAKFCGIVILRLPSEAGTSVILSLLRNFLQDVDLVNNLQGKLAIVEFGHIRIRR